MPSGKIASFPDNPCPPDMVWVEARGFCMDRYEFPNIKGAEPVRDIDFLEAIALCRSRGKRVPYRDEFLAACRGLKKDLYTYGPEFIPGRCRSGLAWADGPSPAGSYTGCVRDGIYDLNGNVWEWVWQEKEGGRKFIAGGAWNTGPDHANCRDFVRLLEVVKAPSVGVRCVMTPAVKPASVPDK